MNPRAGTGTDVMESVLWNVGCDSSEQLDVRAGDVLADVAYREQIGLYNGMREGVVGKHDAETVTVPFLVPQEIRRHERSVKQAVCGPQNVEKDLCVDEERRKALYKV